MQVTTTLMGYLPLGRALCGSSWLIATQHAALPLQQLWHQQAGTQQQHQAFSSLALSSSHNRSSFCQQVPPHSSQHSCFTTSSHASSSAQQQQQQDDANKQDTSSSSSSGSGAQHQIPNLQHEAKEASKNLLAGKFDMDELWFAAVGGRLKVWSAKAHPDLKGREEEVVGMAQEAYYETLQRAATGHLLSTRSRSQLKQACLAASTYKAIVEAVPGSEASAEQFIADLMGGLYAPFMLGGLKVSSWMKRLLLRQSSISQAVDTLHTIARDMEGACHCSVQPLSCGSDSEADDTSATHNASTATMSAATTAAEGEATQQQQQQTDEASEHNKEDEAEAKAAAEAAAQHHGQHHWQLGAALTVDSCLYAEVLKSEGVPQLLKSFCCQHNMSWLDTYSSQGVESTLEACIAKGDGCCRITVTPK